MFSSPLCMFWAQEAEGMDGYNGCYSNFLSRRRFPSEATRRDSLISFPNQGKLQTAASTSAFCLLFSRMERRLFTCGEAEQVFQPSDFLNLCNSWRRQLLHHASHISWQFHKSPLLRMNPESIIMSQKNHESRIMSQESWIMSQESWIINPNSEIIIHGS